MNFWHSVSFWHNELWRGNASDRFHSKWINNSAVWETLAYTSVVPAGPQSAHLIYQKYSLHPPLTNGGWGSNSESFMMKVVLDSPRPKYRRV